MISESNKKIIRDIPGSVFIYMTLRRIFAFFWFISDYVKLKKALHSDRRFSLSISDLKPVLIDKTKTTQFEPHYVYHPAWAARIVAKTKPVKHIDISSILQFSTIVSAFVPVEFYDYRPAKLALSSYKSEHGDLTNLHFPSDSVESLSCMHTLEHIGLGRYGDPIDAIGDIKAASELARVLAPGGSFIFVTPVGKSKIEFNAHRIYSYEQVINLFPTLKLVEFSLVPDDFRAQGFIENADPAIVKDQDWGCGCFVFTK